MTVWVVAGVIVIIALALITLYNRLVLYRQRAREGWSGISVQLKRRADLIPNLVETVKGYASHERQALEEVTRLRTEVAAQPEADVAGRAQSEGLLTAALGRLFAVAEAYPDLKASSNFQELQQALGDVENSLQMSRRYYNGAVRDLNIAVESFPSNLVANLFHFEKAEYFELESAADRAVPKISFDT